MARIFKFQMLCLLTMTLVFCGREEVNQRQGGISGGGGYLIDDSEDFLQLKASQLAAFLELMPETTFTSLPSGWDRRKLFDVIKNVRSSPDTVKFRDGKELMFDYGGANTPTPYIEALKPFFIAYGAQSAVASDKAAIKNLWRRLIHEASHLWGANEQQADNITSQVIAALELDHISCFGDSVEVTIWPGSSSYLAAYQGLNSTSSTSLAQGSDTQKVSHATLATQFRKDENSVYSLLMDGGCALEVESKTKHGEMNCPDSRDTVPLECVTDFRQISFK